jgi:hypothetical protein
MASANGDNLRQLLPRPERRESPPLRFNAPLLSKKPATKAACEECRDKKSKVNVLLSITLIRANVL